jgi:hypothetical protein
MSKFTQDEITQLHMLIIQHEFATKQELPELKAKVRTLNEVVLEEVTDEMVDMILVGACEGGSNYWIDHVDGAPYWSGNGTDENPSVSQGGTMVFVEDLETTEHKLTAEKMKDGIRAAAKLRGKTVERFYEDHDAECADMALQAALFDGKVIYG